MERNERPSRWVSGCLLIVSGAALATSVSSLLVSLSKTDPSSQVPVTVDHRPGQGHPGTQPMLKKNRDPEAPAEGWKGSSMEEAQRHAEADRTYSLRRSPAQVLQDLQRGNTRFWMRTAIRPERSAFERRALIMQQSPSVAVLSCSDSRVPVEIVFDMGLGDMFVVRNAGNVATTTSVASLQYAVNHLKVKVLVVMAHEGCGAVRAAQADDEQLENEPEHLRAALRQVKKGLDKTRLDCVHDRRAHDREAAVTNLRHQLRTLCDDPAIQAQVRRKELIVVGAFYEISSGIVDFIPVESNCQAV
eukprot:TRINITY_DN79054_c0_g1_i1.p1 TRINITY_DN79054_c0_g1~~TRINITY_DN79054_c0_g1_i1.p1  ORF type:complete len:303 (-),score=42.12 TRINITY_DN79054_c0_g1_i1:105-1013(-)